MESDIIKYILPFLGKKYFKDVKVKIDKRLSKEDKGLEELVLKAKGKIKESKLVKKEQKFTLEETIKFEHKIDDKTVKMINYSLKFEKEKTENKGYLVSIDYKENEKEERLDITIKSPDKEKDVNYSFSLLRNKEIKEKPYEIAIKYDESYRKESVNVNYKGHNKDYLKQHLERMNDFASRVLFNKQLDIIPASFMGGVLGFTYLGENYAARRDDLTGKKAFIVDVHEAIHTPDEYETRILTSWILSKEMPKYIK